MSDWKRATREVRFEDLLPEMMTALHHHTQQYNLGPILSDTLMCIQTDSERPKKGLLAKAETVQMVALVTPRWLLWAIRQPNAKVAVLSAQLSHMTLQNYDQTSFAKMIPDSGIEVNGIFTDASESASAFLGLGEDVAGKTFRETVIRAAQDAKK